MISKKVETPISIEIFGDLCYSNLVKVYIEATKGAVEPTTISIPINLCEELLDGPLEDYVKRLAICNGTEIEQEKNKILNAEVPFKFMNANVNIKDAGNTIEYISTAFNNRKVSLIIG